jgi:hypothetical protein
MAFLIPLIFSGIIIAIIRGSKSSQKTRSSFAACARTLGLTHKPGTGPFSHHRLKGKLNGYPVHVRTFTKSAGKNRKTYTRFQVMMPSLGLGLVLSQEGFFSRIASALGSQDIQVGDPIFDPLYQVRGKDARDVIHFLTRERREYLVDAIQALPSLRITDTEIHYERRGIERDSDRMVRTVQRMIRVARILENDSASGQYDRDKKPRQRSYSGTKDSALLEGYLPAGAAAAGAAATAAVTPLFIPRDETGAPDAKILHEDTLAKRAAARAGWADQDSSEAGVNEVTPSPAEDAPASDAPGWSERTPEVETEPAAADASIPLEAIPVEDVAPETYETPVYESLIPESLIDPDTQEDAPADMHADTVKADAAEAPAAADTSLSALCQDLFGASRPSYETKELFESQHAGQPITFQAVIDRVDSYRSDSKLGDGPGTKVTVDLIGLVDEVYTGRDVHALIGLPSEAEAELKDTHGATALVSGTMHACDPFLRVLVLTDGSIQV